jgi:hypothetical protein
MSVCLRKRVQVSTCTCEKQGGEVDSRQRKCGIAESGFLPRVDAKSELCDAVIPLETFVAIHVTHHSIPPAEFLNVLCYCICSLLFISESICSLFNVHKYLLSFIYLHKYLLLVLFTLLSGQAFLSICSIFLPNLLAAAACLL